jgi:hypothetical protein
VPYRSLVQTWHDFYIVAGTASATLVGLLFVSLSLHLRAVLARPEVRGLARATLTNFGLVLLVALMLVIPQDAHGAGLELQATGAISILIIAGPVLAASRSRTRTIPIWLLGMRFALSVLGYAGVVTAGVLLTTGAYGPGFASLAAATIVLLVISLRNTWDLLVSVGEAIVEPESRRDSY